jgi:hypothetical protein
MKSLIFKFNNWWDDLDGVKQIFILIAFVVIVEILMYKVNPIFGFVPLLLVTIIRWYGLTHKEEQ